MGYIVQAKKLINVLLLWMKGGVFWVTAFRYFFLLFVASRLVCCAGPVSNEGLCDFPIFLRLGGEHILSQGPLQV